METTSNKKLNNPEHTEEITRIVEDIREDWGLSVSALKVQSTNEHRAAVKFDASQFDGEQFAGTISDLQKSGYSVEIFGEFFGLEKSRDGRRGSLGYLMQVGKVK